MTHGSQDITAVQVMRAWVTDSRRHETTYTGTARSGMSMPEHAHKAVSRLSAVHLRHAVQPDAVLPPPPAHSRSASLSDPMSQYSWMMYSLYTQSGARPGGTPPSPAAPASDVPVPPSACATAPSPGGAAACRARADTEGVTERSPPQMQGLPTVCTHTESGRAPGCLGFAVGAPMEHPAASTHLLKAAPRAGGGAPKLLPCGRPHHRQLLDVVRIGGHHVRVLRGGDTGKKQQWVEEHWESGRELGVVEPWEARPCQHAACHALPSVTCPRQCASPPARSSHCANRVTAVVTAC